VVKVNIETFPFEEIENDIRLCSNTMCMFMSVQLTFIKMALDDYKLKLVQQESYQDSERLMLDNKAQGSTDTNNYTKKTSENEPKKYLKERKQFNAKPKDIVGESSKPLKVDNAMYNKLNSCASIELEIISEENENEKIEGRKQNEQLIIFPEGTLDQRMNELSVSAIIPRAKELFSFDEIP